MSDKTHHIFSQNPKYGYLNSSMLIDMVTAGKVKFQLDDQLDDGKGEIST